MLRGTFGCRALLARRARCSGRADGGADVCRRRGGSADSGRLQLQPGDPEGGSAGDVRIHVGTPAADRARGLGLRRRRSTRRVWTLGDAPVQLRRHLHGDAGCAERQGEGQKHLQARDRVCAATGRTAAADRTATATGGTPTAGVDCAVVDTSTGRCTGASACGLVGHRCTPRADHDRAFPGRSDHGQLHQARCSAAAPGRDGAGRREDHGALCRARMSVPAKRAIRARRVGLAPRRCRPICPYPRFPRALAQAWRPPADLRCRPGSSRQVHELHDPSRSSAPTSRRLPTAGWRIRLLMCLSVRDRARTAAGDRARELRLAHLRASRVVQADEQDAGHQAAGAGVRMN
ncbi:MAG: hypothetical protein QOD83_3087 [Solirubrobacteraceae bacterium]|nr:hypothetical protein [Solirubrobacteraceae bacterium]